MRQISRSARGAGRTIGLVPTMGALHDGHASLMRRAREECGFTVASIFVNPAQFGPGEDLTRYPRDLERDAALLERLEIDALFCPEPADVYPASPSYRTWVSVEGLSDVLEGRSRPGHFRGVATVVLKLVNMVEPDVVYMGRKDAQQAAVVATMARDLDLPCRIEVCPTVREPDGLAMSSRNAYLDPRQRTAAAVIPRALTAARDLLAGGERAPGALLGRARSVLDGEPLFALDYLELVRDGDFSPVRETRLTGTALLAVAGRIGTTRLIDNIILESRD
jgi:pantoate--beta-alanine ligase